MRVVGVAADDSMSFVRTLGQGADPRVLSFDLGYVLEHPIDATRTEDGDVAVRFRVRPAVEGDPAPERQRRGQDGSLDLHPDQSVEIRQRVAAYALVTSELGILATEFSSRTAVPGRWGLPGGGIDDGEQPTEAVLREVAEETRQVITLGPLVEVQTSHWIGRSPRGVIEDFHAVRLVYTASCEHPTTPTVADIDGTTASARWLPLSDWDSVTWTVGWRRLLRDRLSRCR